MKILFATSSFKGGGITSYAHEVINYYRKDHHLSVMVGDDSQNPIGEDIEMYHIESGDLSFSNALRALKLIKDTIKPEVIINSNAALISLLTPYLPNDIKVITVSHSLKYIEADTAGLNNKYIDSIIALSEHAKCYLSHRFNLKNDERVTVIYNFMRPKIGSEVILRNKLNADPINIVFAGGGSPVKSPDIVAQIVKRMLSTNLNFRFVWIGASLAPLHKISIYKNLYELFQKDKRLIFTGKLSRIEAQEYIEKANIYLFPSRREGCPMSLLEAMRVGTIPIVADYSHANIEIIKDNNNGYVINHEDIDGFVKRISDIIINHIRYKHVYFDNYASYLERFTYEKWSHKMHYLIDNLIIKHKSRRKKLSRFRYELMNFYYKFLKITSRFQIMMNEAIPVYIRMTKLFFSKNI